MKMFESLKNRLNFARINRAKTPMKFNEQTLF